jgi:hypothetical protein
MGKEHCRESRLLASGVLERVAVKAQPTVAEEAETVDYR